MQKIDGVTKRENLSGASQHMAHADTPHSVKKDNTVGNKIKKTYGISNPFFQWRIINIIKTEEAESIIEIFSRIFILLAKTSILSPTSSSSSCS
jgi:hypothetical protein